MALTAEGKVKKALRNMLDKNRWPYNTTTTRGRGRSGHPDYTINADGLYVLCETKVDKPEGTALQHNELERHAQAGSLGFVLARTGLRMYRPSGPGKMDMSTIPANDLDHALKMMESLVMAWVYTTRSGARSVEVPDI